MDYSRALDYGARGSRSLDLAWSYSSVREGEKHGPGRRNQVSFRATADFASGSATGGRWRMTQSRHFGLGRPWRRELMHYVLRIAVETAASSEPDYWIALVAASESADDVAAVGSPRGNTAEQTSGNFPLETDLLVY
jgi:hypothetical protein